MINTDSLKHNSVNVIIGPNGSGKSRLLRKLSADFLREGKKVIAIAPNIFDRFQGLPPKNLRFFGARNGKNEALHVIRDAMKKVATDNIQLAKDLSRILSYVGFEPEIGIEVCGLNIQKFNLSMDNLFGDQNKREGINIPRPQDLNDLLSTLIKWENTYKQHGVVRLGLDSFSFNELDVLSFTKIVQYEKLLRQLGAISNIQFHLYKNGKSFHLLQACSGELWFITTIAFISTHISTNSIIVIDEPETSLHPTWQKEYIQTLLDLFHLYEPCIYISTHSPIIISGADSKREGYIPNDLYVYEMNNGQTKPFDHKHFGLEEMYDKLFGIITPKNHYLSQRAVLLLNDLNEHKQSLDKVIEELHLMSKRSYDSSQQEVLAKLESMARDLFLKHGGNNHD